MIITSTLFVGGPACRPLKANVGASIVMVMEHINSYGNMEEGSLQKWAVNGEVSDYSRINYRA